MPSNERKEMVVEDAQLMFLNFQGKEDQYNEAGNRNFALRLTPEMEKTLLDDGFNVKYLRPREEGDEPTPYLPVAVKFENFPPKIIMITSTARTVLNESTVEVLDYSDIRNVDLIITGYDWAVGDKTGTKAYLKTMFVTLEEDELERKYAVEGETDF